MKRAEILEQARKCVCGEREREYGRPENNFALIGKLGRRTPECATARRTLP